MRVPSEKELTNIFTVSKERIQAARYIMKTIQLGHQKQAFHVLSALLSGQGVDHIRANGQTVCWYVVREHPAMDTVVLVKNNPWKWWIGQCQDWMTTHDKKHVS